MLISRKEKVGEMVRVSASFSVEALKVSDPYHLLTFHHDASVVEPLSWWPVVAESGQLSNCSDKKKPQSSQGHGQNVSVHFIAIQLSGVNKVWCGPTGTLGSWTATSWGCAWVTHSATPQCHTNQPKGPVQCQWHRFSCRNPILHLE